MAVVLDNKTQKAVDKLQKMIGKEYLYNGHNLIIQSLRISDNKIQIATSHKWYEFQFETENKKIFEFIADCLVVDNTTEVEIVQNIKKQELNLLICNKSKMQIVTDTLFANIERLQNDKEYIQQAHAINEQIKSILDLAKTEMFLLTKMK